MDSSKLSDSDLWTKAAPDWDAFQKSGRDIFRKHVVERLIQVVDSSAAAYILDVGCGAGHVTRYLARNGSRVVGVDICPRMINVASSAVAANSSCIQFLCADAASIHVFRDSSFTLAVSVFSLMSMNSISRVFRELNRVCSPDSLIYVYLFYPGIFSERYRPHDVNKNYFSIRCPRFECTIRWEVDGLPRPIFTRTYFRPIDEYVAAAVTGGFSVRELSSWSRGICSQEVVASDSRQVVELVLEHSRRANDGRDTYVC
jgi:ubiquinone/menaquinone biosynthesis C-methylase UbiE